MAESGGPSPGLDMGTQAKLSSGGGGGDKEGFEAIASSIVSIANFFKFLPMKLNNVGEVGLMSGLDLNKAGLDSAKPIPAVGSGLSMQGGALSKVLSAIMKKPDFTNITATIQAADVGPAQNVSMADLGNFRPDFTPAADRGPSMGAAMA